MRWKVKDIVKELDEFVDLSARRARARELFEELCDHFRALLDRAKRARKAGAGNGEPSPRTVAFTLLAGILLPLDVPLQAAMVRAGLPELSVEWCWMIGVGFVGLVAGLAHGWTYGYVYEDERPGRARRIAASVAGVTFMVFLIAAAFAVFAIRLWDPHIASRLRGPAQLSILVAAEAGAVSGGLFGAAAWLGARAWIATRRLARIRRRARGLIEVGDYLAHELPADTSSAWSSLRTEIEALVQEQPEPPVASGPGGSTRPAATVVLIAAIATSTMSACTSAGASSGTVAVDGAVKVEQQPTSRPATAPAQHADSLCAFLLDETDSQNPDDRKVALGLLDVRLVHILGQLHCATAGVASFADAGEWTNITYFDLPAAPDVDCASAQPVVFGLDRLLQVNQAFREAGLEEARKACEAQRGQVMKQFAASSEPIRVFIREADTNPPRQDGRTDIAGAIRAVLRKRALIFVLTDGLDTAHRAPLKDVPIDATVVIVAIPARPEKGGLEATRAAGEVWSQIERVKVVPYAMLSDPEFTERIRTP